MTNNAVNLYFQEAEKDYRKDTSTEVWHFRSDCSRWPQSIYVSLTHLPEDAAICKSCIERSKQ